MERGAASPGQVSLVPAPLATAIIFSFQMSAVWPQQLHQGWGGGGEADLCVWLVFLFMWIQSRCPRKIKAHEFPSSKKQKNDARRAAPFLILFALQTLLKHFQLSNSEAALNVCVPGRGDGRD